MIFFLFLFIENRNLKKKQKKDNNKTPVDPPPSSPPQSTPPPPPPSTTPPSDQTTRKKVSKDFKIANIINLDPNSALAQIALNYGSQQANTREDDANYPHVSSNQEDDDDDNDAVRFRVEELTNVFHGAFRETKIYFQPEFTSVWDMIVDLSNNSEFKDILKNIPDSDMYTSYQLHICVQFSKVQYDGDILDTLYHINCKIRKMSEYIDMMNNLGDEILSRIDRVEIEGSGFNITAIPFITICFMRGSRHVNKRVKIPKKLGAYKSVASRRSRIQIYR